LFRVATDEQARHTRVELRLRSQQTRPLQDRDIIGPAGLNDAELHIALPVLAVFARKIEQEAHNLLRAKRFEGEWFLVEPGEAVDAIERALVTITRLAAVEAVPSGRNRRALDASTDAGKAIIARRLAAL
jgi:Meiotically up-regulated gene 113